MVEIVIFPLVLRPPSQRVAKRDREDVLAPFPFSRRRNLVDRHARAMRALDPDRAEAYLTEVLEKICAELTELGIDCEDCQSEAICEFADAIGKQLHGPHFQIEEAAK